MAAAIPTGTPAPESVVANAPAAAVAQPAAAEPAPAAEANPWDHGDEYSPDPSLAVEASPTAQDPNQQTSAQQEVPPAGALNTDTTSAPTPDGQQPPSTAPGPIPYERFKEKVDELGTVKQMAEFYQKAYNELVSQGQAAPAQAPGTQTPKPGAADSNSASPGAVTEPGKLPAGILGPGEWETQEEMAAYHEHVARQEIGQVLQQHVAPQMQAINKWVGQLEEMLVRQVHPDFDEVTGAVMGELFVTDHEGKVWTDPQGLPKVKNPALLSWIRQSPMPRKALYDYALQKRAPQKITEAVQNNTKQLLTALDTRPKGPTQPRVAAGDNRPVSLDWDTPKDVADRVLSERGVI
jgi:hypothetical protein